MKILHTSDWHIGQVLNFHNAVGMQQQQLEEAHKAVSDSKKSLDALQQQVRQWERLSNTFGDSTGRTFRRIAQSFILQRLLDQTNYFLGMLSDRYELIGAGRELMILVKDKYSGSALSAIWTVLPTRFRLRLWYGR